MIIDDIEVIVENGERVKVDGPIWTYSKEKYSETFKTSCLPVIAGGKVVVVSDTNLICLRIKDGKLLWKTSLESTRPVNSEELVVAGDLVIFTIDRDVYAYSVNNGQMVWHSRPVLTRVGIFNRLTVDDEHIYLPGIGFVAQISLNNGEVVREFAYEFENYQSSELRSYQVCVNDDKLIVPVNAMNQADSSVSGVVNCISKYSGELVWRYQIPYGREVIKNRRNDVGPTAISASGEMVFIVSMTYSVVALDANDGSVLWSRRINMGTYPHVMYSDDSCIVFGTVNGDVIALDKDDGEYLWDVAAKYCFNGVLKSTRTMLYFQNPLDYQAYLISKADGTVLWKGVIESSDPLRHYHGGMSLSKSFMIINGYGDVYCYKLEKGSGNLPPPP